MGTNMLRYALWKASGSMPVVATITGENNPQAGLLAQREHYHKVYLLSKNKANVFESFCGEYELKPEEVLFFFDDVLDMEVAGMCGARVMIGRAPSPLLRDFAIKNQYADYVTANHGGRNGLRERCQLVIGLLGQFDWVVTNRMKFTSDYQAYLAQRQSIQTSITQGKTSKS